MVSLYRTAPRKFRGGTAARGYFTVDQRYFDWSVDPSILAQAISNPESLAKALPVAQSTFRSNPMSQDCGVYVLEVEGLPVCKVGMSASPLDRREQIQSNHWADIKIAGVLWARQDRCVAIERTVLKAASEMGVRLRGEWIGAPSEEVCELVVKAGRYLDARACDSSALMANMSDAVSALRTYAVRNMEQGRKYIDSICA